MEKSYSIDELSRICKVTKQALYNQMSKNKKFFQDNSKKQSRKLMYNQAVLKHFLNYYAIEQEEIKPEEPNGQETINVTQSIANENQVQTDELRAIIAEQEEKIRQLEEERKELMQQNGLVLLLLQQEKAEKQRLLPPANDRTLWNRLKAAIKPQHRNP